MKNTKKKRYFSQENLRSHFHKSHSILAPQNCSFLNTNDIPDLLPPSRINLQNFLTHTNESLCLRHDENQSLASLQKRLANFMSPTYSEEK